MTARPFYCLWHLGSKWYVGSTTSDDSLAVPPPAAARSLRLNCELFLYARRLCQMPRLMVIATIMVVMATMLLGKTASRQRQVIMDLAAVIGTERAAMAADLKTRSSWARLPGHLALRMCQAMAQCL